MFWVVRPQRSSDVPQRSPPQRTCGPRSYGVIYKHPLRIRRNRQSSKILFIGCIEITVIKASCGVALSSIGCVASLPRTRACVRLCGAQTAIHLYLSVCVSHWLAAVRVEGGFYVNWPTQSRLAATCVRRFQYSRPTSPCMALNLYSKNLIFCILCAISSKILLTLENFSLYSIFIDWKWYISL